LLLTVSTIPLLVLCPLFLDAQAPGDPESQYVLATRLYDEANFREALDAYDTAIGAADADLATRARKGKVRTALRIAEFDLAHREAELLSTDEGTDAEALTLYGDALWANRRFGARRSGGARARRPRLRTPEPLRRVGRGVRALHHAAAGEREQHHGRDLPVEDPPPPRVPRTGAGAD
jgi:hypothetical protein